MTMDAYIDKIAREFDLENAPRVSTPLSLDASKFVPFDGHLGKEVIWWQRFFTQMAFDPGMTLPLSPTIPKLLEF